MNPAKLWRISIWFYEKGFVKLARIIKALNFFMFRCILPPEASIGSNLTLGHYGLGVVVHPNVVIGNNVHLWHGVTLAVATPVGSSIKMVIEDDVTIGAKATIVSRENQAMKIGTGSVVGAGSVVVDDVPAKIVVAGNPAVELHSRGAGKSSNYR